MPTPATDEEKPEGNDAFEAAFVEFANGKDATATTENAAIENASTGDKPEVKAEEGTKTEDDAGAKADAAATAAAPAEGAKETVEQDPKAALEAAQAELAKLKHRVQSDSGRIAAYQRENADLKKQAPAKAGAAEKVEDGDDPDLKHFKEEYPEIAGPVAKMLSAKDKKIETLETTLAAYTADKQVEHAEKEESVLTSLHSDWKDITKSPQFLEWIGSQQRFVQEAAERNGQKITNGHEAAEIIGFYKLSAGIKPAPAQDAAGQADAGKSKSISGKRAKQLESAAAVQSKGPGVASGPPDDFDGAFAHFAAKRK